MNLADLVETSAAVASTSGRLEKSSRLAELLKRLSPDEIRIAIGFLTGWPRQGRLGAGWATVSVARERDAATVSTLSLLDVDLVFDQLMSVRGKSSGNERARLVGDLFARATIDEQH